MLKTIVPIIVWLGFDRFRPVHNHNPRDVFSENWTQTCVSSLLVGMGIRRSEPLVFLTEIVCLCFAFFFFFFFLFFFFFFSFFFFFFFFFSFFLFLLEQHYDVHHLFSSFGFFSFSFFFFLFSFFFFLFFLLFSFSLSSFFFFLFSFFFFLFSFFFFLFSCRRQADVRARRTRTWVPGASGCLGQQLLPALKALSSLCACLLACLLACLFLASGPPPLGNQMEQKVL